MVKWNSSPHPISDIRDWSQLGRLELRPDFQRRAVWTQVARVMLMDTILKGIPMPKIFVASTIKKTHTYRIVIDGQQRMTAILDFLNDGYVLDEPYIGEHYGKKFSELNEETQNIFLQYKIDFNEALNPSDEEVREVYSRVNKYIVALNNQELRKADYPGDFLNLSEKLANNEMIDSFLIFTPANRRRYNDVEYISEILSAILGGIPDKKTTLDEFYKKYSKWDFKELQQVESNFLKAIVTVQKLFSDKIPISKTRFRQKADFYTIFLVLYGYVISDVNTDETNFSDLQEDLQVLDFHIAPESHIPICSEYAIKCLSQSNTISSRKWRFNFLKSVLDGTFLHKIPDNEGSKIFYDVTDHATAGDLCPDPIEECPICNEEITEKMDSILLAWPKLERNFQMSNSFKIHEGCSSPDWIVLTRPIKK